MGCLFVRAWKVTLKGDAFGKSRGVRMTLEWNEVLHTLLCFLSWSLPFTASFLSVECSKDLSQVRTPFCSTLWTGFRLISPNTVMLWCTTMGPYDFKSDRSAKRQGTGCLPHQGEQGAPVNARYFPCRHRMKKQAFLLTEHGSWLGVHREASNSFVRYTHIFCAWQCW